MKRCFITLILIINSLCTQAQTIGLGASVNHLSNGLNIEYKKNPKLKKYDYTIGVKLIINTINYNQNLQNYIYYQNGYAKHFYERFALNFSLNRNIIRYKKFNLQLTSNNLITYHSLIEKANDVPDLFTGILSDDIIYRKPAPSLEITLGPKFSYNIYKNITISGQVGFGIILLGYKQEGVSLITGKPVGYIVVTKINQYRGDIEYVGLDGLPSMLLSVNYKLNKRKK